MTETLLIDYAWTHPNPAAIKAAGYTGVLRYLSHDPTKDLTAAEVAALHAAGLAVGIIWETTATRAAEGYQAGVADRLEAERRAVALGYPHQCPILYAVDADLDPTVVMPYFHGVNVANVFPVGGYGSLRMVETLHGAQLLTVAFQTEAWSGTAVSPVADVYQRIKPTRTIAGAIPGKFDEDVLITPFPLWTAAGTLPADVEGITRLHPPETLGLLGQKYFGDGVAGGQRIRDFYGNKKRCASVGVTTNVWAHPRATISLLIPKQLHP